VNTEGTNEFCPIIIVSKNGTTIAVAAKRLCRKKGCGCNIAKTTSFLLADLFCL